MKTKKKITAAALSLSLTALLAVPALAAEPSTESASEAPASASRFFSIQDYGSGQALTDEEAIALLLSIRALHRTRLTVSVQSMTVTMD